MGTCRYPYLIILVGCLNHLARLPCGLVPKWQKKQLSSIVDVFINYVKFSMNKKNYLNFNVNVLES
jgi:hypothetical protein